MDPNLQVPYADSWTVGCSARSAATWRSRSATSARGRATVGRRSTTTRSTSSTTGSSTSSGCAQANLQANVAAGRGSDFALPRARHRHGRRCRSSSAYFQRRRRSRRQRRGVHVGELRTNNTFMTPLATFNPNPFTLARTASYADAAQRNNAAATPACPGELLPRESGSARRRQRDDQRRQVRLQRDAARVAPPAVAGTAVRARTTRSATQQSRTWQTFRRDVFMIARRRRSGRRHPRVQAERASTICRSARAGASAATSTACWTASSAAGRSSVHLAHPERPADRFRQRADGRHDERRSAGHVQAAVRRCRQEGVDAAAGRHRRDDQGVQRQRDVRDRLRRRRTPTGRYFAPANGPDCIEIDNGADYGDCGMRSLVVTGPMFQHARLQRRRSGLTSSAGELRVPLRDAERIQQRELRSGERHRQQRRRHPQQLRGDWPDGREHGQGYPARHTVQLVGHYVGPAGSHSPAGFLTPVLAGTAGVPPTCRRRGPATSWPPLPPPSH